MKRKSQNHQEASHICLNAEYPMANKYENENLECLLSPQHVHGKFIMIMIMCCLGLLRFIIQMKSIVLLSFLFLLAPVLFSLQDNNILA